MCDQAKKFPYQERYIIINEFEDIVLGYTIHVILTEGGENFKIKEINYKRMYSNSTLPSFKSFFFFNTTLFNHGTQYFHVLYPIKAMELNNSLIVEAMKREFINAQ